MTSLLRLFEQLVSDPDAKAMFRDAPDRFLADAGFGDLPIDDVTEALAHAADAFPPALANAIQPEFGLDRLVDIDLGSLGLGGFDDFSSIWEPGEDLIQSLAGDNFDDDFLPELPIDLDEVDDALADVADEASSELSGLWERLAGDDDGVDGDGLEEDAFGVDVAFEDPFGTNDDADALRPSDADDDADAAFDLDYDDGYGDLL